MDLSVVDDETIDGYYQTAKEAYASQHNREGGMVDQAMTIEETDRSRK